MINQYSKAALLLIGIASLLGLIQPTTLQASSEITAKGVVFIDKNQNNKKDKNEKEILTNQSLTQDLVTLRKELQAKAAKGGATKSERALDSDDQAELRALGYIE